MEYGYFCPGLHLAQRSGADGKSEREAICGISVSYTHLDVYKRQQKHYDELRFSPGVRAAGKEQKKNPKRMQREAEKQLKRAGAGTKSQQALKLQQEQLKMNRKGQKRRRTEEEKKRKFELKQQKKKEKHKGR